MEKPQKQVLWVAFMRVVINLLSGEHTRIWKPPIQVNDWTEVANQRKFFDNFAKENNFDPLNPDNWYKVERRDVFEQVTIYLAISKLIISGWSRTVSWLLFWVGHKSAANPLS